MRNAAQSARDQGHVPTRFAIDTESSAVSHCIGCGAIISVDITEKPYIFGKGTQEACTYSRVANCSCSTCQIIRRMSA